MLRTILKEQETKKKEMDLDKKLREARGSSSTLFRGAAKLTRQTGSVLAGTARVVAKQSRPKKKMKKTKTFSVKDII